MKMFTMLASLLLSLASMQATEAQTVAKAPTVEQINMAHSTWTLVVVYSSPSGSYATSGVGAAITLPGFNSKDQCLSQLKFVKVRDEVYDAYCIQVL